jgi:hypothetical protein
MFFYELHEGDDEVYADVLLFSDSEWEPEEFFDLVQSIRRRVQDTHSGDTLSEAIAVVLERDHGFVFISDARIAAAVNVSTTDEDNFLAEIEADDDDAEEDEEDEDGGYRTILAEFDPDGDRLPH